MNNIRTVTIEFFPGTYLGNAIEESQNVAKTIDKTVKFGFNGVKYTVEPSGLLIKED